MSLQSSRLSYEELKMEDLSLGRPKRMGLAGLAIPLGNENELEDMMMDSAIASTPPLDLETDSGDDPEDFELTMRSPVSPPSSFPASISHHHRKHLQEHGSAALDSSDSNQGQEATAPVLVNYGKGAQGRRRPAVTFDLDPDDEPFSPPTKMSARFALDANQRPIGFRHDDGENKADTDGYSQDEEEDLTGAESESNPDTRDKVQLVEQGLRRVSIASDADDDNDDQVDKVQEQPFSVAAVENSSPQDVILDHVFIGTAPQDMLVALFDRSSELQALAARHSEFFSLMYSSISKTSRDHFKTVLFKPREDLSDRDWMSAVSEYLGPLPPCILERFKDMVGWIGSDYDDEENVLWGEDEYGYRNSSFEQVQVKWFRDIEDFALETFQECYPQFFVNAREQLEGRRLSYGGDRRDQYVIFCETLSLTRQDLACDNAWARRMNGCLEKHPELLLQFKEIIAYEVEYDD